MTLERIFQSIGSDMTSKALGMFSLAKTDVLLPEGCVYVAEGTRRHRHLLIPIPTRKELRKDEVSRGIVMEEMYLQDDGHQKLYLSVECTDPDFNRLFAIIAGEMLAVLGTGDAFAACVSTLDRWRALLNAPPGPPLGDRQLAGIFGELLVLEQLCLVDVVRGFDAWQGPLGSDQDFLHNHRALEVKATLKKHSWEVQISSLKQLDDSMSDALHLGVFRLLKSPYGTPITELVERICAMGVNRAQLMSKLAEVRYREAHQERYADFRVEIDDFRFYQVKDGFPRLTATTIGACPQGVQNVSYALDLEAAESYRCEKEYLKLGEWLND